jgi:hypothetical protein
MVDVLADPRRHQFIGGHPATLEELRARYARLTAGSPRLEEVWRNWIVRRRADSRPVGTVSAGLTADTCTTSSPTSTPITSRRQRWPCEPVSSPPTTRSTASRPGIDRRAGRGRVAGGADEARAAGSHSLHLPRELGGRPGLGWQQRTGPARPRVGLAAAGVGGHRQDGPADRGGRGGRRGVGGLDGLDDGRVPPLPNLMGEGHRHADEPGDQPGLVLAPGQFPAMQPTQAPGTTPAGRPTAQPSTPTVRRSTMRPWNSARRWPTRRSHLRRYLRRPDPVPQGETTRKGHPKVPLPPAARRLRKSAALNRGTAGQH